MVLPEQVTDTPFVTCLCLTKDRRQWLPKAIECFQAQTYPNRELLIVADGDDVTDLVPNDTRIRLLRITSGFLIGAKRNFGVGRALGDIVAHWDDDDYSAPGRLADQVNRMQSENKSVTGYHTMRFTDGTKWWLYRGQPYFALGTSLCYRKQWALGHPFPERQVGEDNEFGGAAHKSGQLVSVTAGETPADELMHACVHDGNTSKKAVDRYRPLPA